MVGGCRKKQGYVEIARKVHLTVGIIDAIGSDAIVAVVVEVEVVSVPGQLHVNFKKAQQKSSPRSMSMGESIH